MAPETYRPTIGKIAGWATVGVGGAVMLTGGAFWLKSFLQQQNPPGYYQDYTKAFGRETSATTRGTKTRRTIRPRSRSTPRQSPTTATPTRRRRPLRVHPLPVGAVIAGVGTYLLVTDKPQHEKAEGRRVQPFLELGPRGGRLDVRMTF